MQKREMKGVQGRSNVIYSDLRVHTERLTMESLSCEETYIRTLFIAITA